MKLLNSKNAVIPKEKLIKYVLSETHPIGKFKAKLFRSLGFNETNLHLFEKELQSLAKLQDVKDIVKSQYGTKYIIEGQIRTPNRTVLKIQTVWIIEKNQNIPRFVTVYPV